MFWIYYFIIDDTLLPWMPYFNTPQLYFKCNWVMIYRVQFKHSDHSLGDEVDLSITASMWSKNRRKWEINRITLISETTETGSYPQLLM